ncbi:S1 family peptidase [Enterovibrio baiacu]|uniref:S1 family peptidase n=1 Tax=Enterovibrio baiacu TaxID=2491023 RepID=UPI001011ED55|nr:serine protease [Enterovibrio baiacu]MBE1277426.1 serine protease [Enterovibrio baiacu]
MRIKQWMAVVSLAAAISPMTAMAVTESAEKSPRIVGGQVASIDDAPWQVYISLNNAFFGGACGGTIISDKYVVTAAHCVDVFSASDVVVYAGSSNWQQGFQILVEQIIQHEDYDSNTFEADIAMLKLSSPLPNTSKPLPLLSPDIQIDLDAEFETAEINNLFLSGWGATDTSGTEFSSSLKGVLMTGISDEQCSWTKDRSGNIIQQVADAIVCTNHTAAVGVCDGDSGGPLVWQDPQHASDSDLGFRLVGITSFGYVNCANVNYEDGFTQLTQYYDWINDNIDGGYNSPTVSFSSNPFASNSGFAPSSSIASSGGGGGGAISLYALLLLSFTLGLSIYSRRRFLS